MESQIQHDADGFGAVTFMLHLWIRDDDGQIGLMPCGKHPEQTGLTYNIAVQICDGKPDRIFRFVIDGDAGFYLFFGGGLLKAALKHNFRLIEPVGKKRYVIFPLLAQNDPASFDFLIHTLS